MNPLRKLASQTAVYGLSSIIGRFLNYLLVPLYTYTFPAEAYGVVSEFYAYAGFFSVLLVFGLETGYFRFRTRDGIPQGSAYAGSLLFVLAANAFFISLLIAFRQPLADQLRYPDHPEYLVCFGLILALDAVSALPFAKLRAEEKALRFAGIKIAEIIVAIGFNLLFLLAWPRVVALWPGSAFASYYNPSVGVGYIFLANLIASVFKMLLLLPQFRGISLKKGLEVIRPLLAYSLPMVIIGFAGVINEMLDRAILKYLLPYDLKENLRILGVYGACYKLSILMTLFVQAFRYAGEPFFFAYAGREDAKRSYALVLKYFVIFCVFIFLLVTLFLEFFKYFVGADYREGLDVVPILLMANLFLGIYVNLSIWYKLTDRTGMGAWISMAAAFITLGLNFWWIPLIGYRGSAWAHLVCYGGMALVSYLLGRHYYPVPYPVIRITLYMLLGLAIYWLDHELVVNCGFNVWATGSVLLISYVLIAFLSDFMPLFRRGAKIRAVG